MAKPLLEIETLIERPTIIIDEEAYEIRSPDELSVIDTHRLSSQGRRLNALMSRDKIKPAEKKELSKLLHAISDFIMVGVPNDIRDNLSDPQRMEIAEVFTALPLQKHMAKALAAEAKLIGAKRRPGSKGSTAATRRGGSTKRRSRSSEPT